MTRKFIMIASSKGGVGKSTAALGISRALCSLGYRVLLCDLDFGNACLDMLLGVQDSVMYTVQDVAMGHADSKNALLKIEDEGKKKKRSKKKKAENEGILLLLPSVAGGVGCSPSYGGENTSESDDRILSAIKDAADSAEADFVIMDTGAGVNSAVGVAARLSDTALVVSGHMPVALRSAEATVSRLSEMGVKDIRLLINAFDAAGVVESSRNGLFSVIDESRAPLAGVIPYDYQLMLQHERLFFSEKPADRAFSNIAHRLCGDSVPLFSGMKRIRKMKNKICL